MDFAFLANGLRIEIMTAVSWFDCPEIVETLEKGTLCVGFGLVLDLNDGIALT
jgi:hypothetical protein